MALHSITCAGCGDEVKARVKNTQFCYPCRILTDHTGDGGDGWRTRSRTCECGLEFWPLRQGHYACYWCTDRRSGFREDHTCHNCGKHNQPAPAMEKICTWCVQATKEKRNAYIVALKRKQRDKKFNLIGVGV